MSETIHALASASGRAGVAVVRLSGDRAIEALQALCESPAPPDRYLSLRNIWKIGSSKQDWIDQALVVVMSGPHSFTGEDCVEIHLHGGVAISNALFETLNSAGLSRHAQPGEFTRRAFENGKLDLTQSEAIADLIDAETDQQRRQALNQFQGSLNVKIADWRNTLIQAMSSLEASIDFPDEEDVPIGVETRAYELVARLENDMTGVLLEAHKGIAVRDGFKIAIIGEPNAGKSSLLNHLAGRDAAIVTEIPGTTRDVLDVRLNLSGYSVILSDTAGIRSTNDIVEREGVKRAISNASDANLRLHLVPAQSELSTLQHLQSGDILIRTKSDLLNSDAGNPLDFGVKGREDYQRMAISSRTGEGMGSLISAITESVVEQCSVSETALLTRKRHEDLLNIALSDLRSAKDCMDQNRGPELTSESLRMVIRALSNIIGDVDVEDLLDRIFSEFCIGK